LSLKFSLVEYVLCFTGLIKVRLTRATYTVIRALQPVTDVIELLLDNNLRMVYLVLLYPRCALQIHSIAGCTVLYLHHWCLPVRCQVWFIFFGCSYTGRKMEHLLSRKVNSYCCGAWWCTKLLAVWASWLSMPAIELLLCFL